MEKNFTLLNDASLLLKIREGDKNAFNTLYERYWEQAFSAAHKRLKDIDQAKDIVQEIFVNIWLKKETCIANFPAYLNIAVRNQVFKLIEKQKKTCSFLDFLHDVSLAHQQADTNILWKEFLKSYEALLSTLPPKRQKIFRLRFQEDLPTNIIAEQMGISRKTVQNQLGKAIDQMRGIVQLFIFCLYFL